MELSKQKGRWTLQRCWLCTNWVAQAWSKNASLPRKSGQGDQGEVWRLEHFKENVAEEGLLTPGYGRQSPQ